MRIAYIQDGRIHELFECDSWEALAEIRSPDFIERCVECADTAVVEGDLWDGETFSAPPVVEPGSAPVAEYVPPLANAPITYAQADMLCRAAQDEPNGGPATVLLQMFDL